MPKPKTKTKLNKKKYQLTVRIGKENQPDAVIYRFKNIAEVDDYKELIKCLLTIPTAKIMLNVNVVLEKDGLKATRDLPSFKAKLAFTNEMNAFMLMKYMHLIFK